MKIIKWNRTDIPDLERHGINEVLTEVDSCGLVVREIGLRSSGEVAYLAPVWDGVKKFGLFDGAVVDLSSLNSDDFISSEIFECLWRRKSPDSEV